MASTQYGSLPFQEQIDFFRSKVSVDTDAWTDVYGREHSHAFMVAGARGDVLTDMRRAIDRFISDGHTIEDFRRDFDDVVAKTGWAYNGGRNWRTRVIYETNLRQSYAAGREAQLADPEVRRARPYGLYRHGGSRDPRPEHLALDGTVLPLDDPWWDTWSPMNGWGCSCKKYTLSQDDVERLGLTVLDKAPPTQYEDRDIGVRGTNPRTVRVPKGIDPGFEYAPGANRISGMIPPPVNTAPPVVSTVLATDALPSARSVPASLRIARDTPEQYIAAFLGEFGVSAGASVYFADKAGERLLIGDQLFRHRGTGELKVLKRGRATDVLLLATAIKEPDEIWVNEVEVQPGIVSLQRVYMAQFLVEGEAEPMLVVFEMGRWGWTGVTAYGPDSKRRLEKNRAGARVYRRGDAG